MDEMAQLMEEENRNTKLQAFLGGYNVSKPVARESHQKANDVDGYFGGPRDAELRRATYGPQRPVVDDRGRIQKGKVVFWPRHEYVDPERGSNLHNRAKRSPFSEYERYRWPVLTPEQETYTDVDRQVKLYEKKYTTESDAVMKPGFNWIHLAPRIGMRAGSALTQAAMDAPLPQPCPRCSTQDQPNKICNWSLNQEGHNFSDYRGVPGMN